MYLNLLGKQWCCDEFIEYFNEIASYREIYVVTSDNPKITRPTFREKKVQKIVVSAPYEGVYHLKGYISPAELVLLKMKLKDAIDSPLMEDIPQQNRIFNTIKSEFAVDEHYSVENSLMLKLNDMNQPQKLRLLSFLANFDDNSPEALITLDLNQATKPQLDMVELWLNVSRASDFNEDDDDIADESDPFDLNPEDDESNLL